MSDKIGYKVSGQKIRQINGMSNRQIKILIKEGILDDRKTEEQKFKLTYGRRAAKLSLRQIKTISKNLSKAKGINGIAFRKAIRELDERDYDYSYDY